MKILGRYVLKEHFGPLMFALTALTSLLLLNYIAKNFGELVGKGLPWHVIAEFFVLSVPFTFAMTLPMAVLVAVLYAFSRLASENEITAMKASGVGMNRLVLPVLVAATVIAIGMVGFNDQVLSRSNHRLAILQRDIFRTRPTFALKEQVINTLQEGRLYLRAGRIERGSSHMKEVVVYDQSDPTRRRTILADSGEISFAPNRRDLFMTLYDGVMQEVPTANPEQLTRLFYKQDRIRVVGVGSQFEESRMAQGKSDREMTICEMTSAVLAAERRRAMAEDDYRRIQSEAARARNGAPRDTQRWKFEPPTTLGGLYCSLLNRLGAIGVGVKEAQAAQAPSQGQGRAQGTAARRAARDSAGRTTAVRDTASRDTAVQAAAAQDSASRAAAARATTARTTGPDTVARRRGLVGRRLVPPRQLEDTASPSSAGAGGALTPRDSVEVRIFKSRLDDARDQIDMHAKTRDRYLVEIHKKFSLAVCCIVFVLIGAPIALRFPRGGVGLVIGVSLAIFALYYVGLIGGEALADRGFISPFWGMWGHNVILAVVGAFMTARMGREGETARGGDWSDMLETVRVTIAKAGRKVGIPLDRRRRLA